MNTSSGARGGWAVRDLTSAMFRNLDPKAFELSLTQEESLPLELIEVRSSNLPERAGVRSPFSVFFRGTPNRYLPQAMYPIRHPELGQHFIFIVPVAHEPAGTYIYQATFS